jgi:tetratricopeptide (TPR) repeat protein
MRYTSFLLLPIVLTVLSACQASLPPQAPPVPPVSADQGLNCPTDSEEARLAYNRGVDRTDQANPEEAIQAFRQALALDPMYCDAMVSLGHLLRRQGQSDEAIIWYQRAIEIFPHDPLVRNKLATAYRRQGNFQAAIAEHQWMIRMYADDPEGHFGLGIDYLQMDDCRRALKPLEAAERLYSRNASPLVVDARHALGVAAYKLKDFKKSRYYFEQIYDRFQEDAAVNYALGLCHVFEGQDLDAARKYLRKARQLGATIPAELEREVDL